MELTTKAGPAGPQTFARRLALLAAAALVLFGFRLGSVSVFDLDEALYAGCARQMVATGDWITPRLNTRPLYAPERLTSPFYEKPIMVYWLPALSMKLFGVSETAARLPVLLASLAATLAIALLGRRWISPDAGLLAGAIYALCPMTVLDARQMTTDALLVLWFLVAMGSYRELRTGTASGPGMQVLFWSACGLAVLTKGVVGILLPALVIGVDLCAAGVRARMFSGGGRRFVLSAQLSPWKDVLSALRAIAPALGVVLLLAIALPWHILIARTSELDHDGRTFITEYFVRQHVGRFRGLDKVHNAPMLTYVVYFLLGFFPWACFVPAAFRRWREPRIVPDSGGGHADITPEALTRDTRRFLLVWFWTIVGFFTLGAAKLPTYIVPAYPAAALLVGAWMARALRSARSEAIRGQVSRASGAAAICAVLLAVAALAAPGLAPPNAPLPLAVVAVARAVTLLLAGGCSIAWITARGGRPIGAAGFLAGTLAVVVLVGVAIGYPVADAQVLGPCRQTAMAANGDAARGVPVLYVGVVPRRPSMLFYSTYSPLECNTTKALSLLERLQAKGASAADLIASADVYEAVQRELTARHPAWRTDELARRGALRGGWIEVRVTMGALLGRAKGD